MRTLVFIISGMVFLSSGLFSLELSQEELLRRVAEALGGAAAWTEIKTMEVSGNHSSFSRTRRYLMLRERPSLYRLNYNEGSRDLVIGYDGEVAWWDTVIAMVSKASWPVAAPIAHARAIRADARFAPPFVMVDSGIEIEVSGLVELEGEQLYKVVVKLSDGEVEEWYVDTQTFLPVARISTGAYHGVPAEQRSFYSDYRKVERIAIPYHVEIEIGNDFLEFNVDQVRLNVDVDKDVFSLPLPTGMEWLQGLAGHWSVKVACRMLPGGPWLETETSSVIEEHQRGAFLAEKMSYDSCGFRWDVERFFSYDRFREVFRIVQLDNFTSQADVLQGLRTEDRLIVSNVATGTPWIVYDNVYHSREVIYDIDGGSFKVDREISVDGGKTWNIERRFVYVRQEAR